MQKFQENCTAASFTEETENKVTECNTKLRLKLYLPLKVMHFPCRKAVNKVGFIVLERPG